LDDGSTVGVERPVDNLEVAGKREILWSIIRLFCALPGIYSLIHEFLADGLNHLNRDNPVEGALPFLGDRAVVEKMDGDRVGETGGLDALTGENGLLDRKGKGVDNAASRANGL
jgi:hypothetical protein